MSESELNAADKKVLAGLTELRDRIRTDPSVQKLFTARKTTLAPEPAEYAPEDVKALRESLNASQTVFALLLGVDADTVRSWEQGKRNLSKMARRFLDEIKADPERYRARLKSSARNTARTKSVDAE